MLDREIKEGERLVEKLENERRAQLWNACVLRVQSGFEDCELLCCGQELEGGVCARRWGRGGCCWWFDVSGFALRSQVLFQFFNCWSMATFPFSLSLADTFLSFIATLSVTALFLALVF